MNINILIVDDDIMIRNLLGMLIEQIEKFTGTVSSVASADEAEAFCDAKRIDLVISDITMPNRSGLDLIRALRKKHPEIQIACLSAYDDYEYIRKALKEGVLDYILKSEMKLEDIVSLLDKVESFSSITQDSPIEKDEMERLEENNGLLEQYLDEEVQAEDVCARMNCGMDTGVIVLAFQLQRQAASTEELLKAQAIAEKTREAEQNQGLSFICEGERVVMLIKDSFESIETREKEMIRLSLLYKRNLLEYCKQNVVFSLYEPAQDFYQLHRTIIQTMDLMDAYAYYPNYKKGVAPLRELSEDDARVLRSFAEKNVECDDLKAASDAFCRKIQQWHQAYMIPREVKSAAICGLFYLMERNEVRSPHSLLVYNRYAKRLRYVENKDCMERLLNGALESVVSKYASKDRIHNPSVRAAVKYINENYHRKITLDDVAKHIFLNRTYASQVFKKHMQVNFAEYLEMVRVNRAKELLLGTELPITEIAAQVGYSNQSYFTKVFKRSTGFSPNSFRVISKKQ